MKYSSLIPELKKIIVQAGEIVMGYYQSSYATEIKQDNSPVTIADKESDKFLKTELLKLDKKITYVSEENLNNKSSKLFWLVDPLDGTKSFMKKGKNFVINIALIENGVPVLGLIYAPYKKELYYSDGKKSYEEIQGLTKELKKPTFDRNAINIASSQFHSNVETERFLEKIKGRVKENIAISSAYKFCLLAKGEVDLYPRFGNTSFWDVASGHAIIKTVGLEMVDLNGKELIYSNKNFLTPYFMAGHKELIEEFL
jgi:3'(2'), 5'-bisphosphate nucleotidase